MKREAKLGLSLFSRLARAWLRIDSVDEARHTVSGVHLRDRSALKSLLTDSRYPYYRRTDRRVTGSEHNGRCVYVYPQNNVSHRGEFMSALKIQGIVVSTREEEYLQNTLYSNYFQQFELDICMKVLY